MSARMDRRGKVKKATSGRRLAMMVVRTAVLGYVAICVFMYLYQYRLIYLPDRELSRTPGEVGIVAEEIALTTADGVRISAWYGTPEDARGAVILCHGNAGDMADRLDIARVFYANGLAVLLFDYRGYGRSEGTPDEAGTYADAEAAWAYVTQERGWAADRVIVYGESIGGAVAIELARRHEPAGLITEGAFTTLVDVARGIYPFLPVKLLARARYESIRKVPQISCPKLFIHSPDDEIVPFALGRELSAAAAEPKQFLQTRGGHNDGGFLADREYMSQVVQFIDEVLGVSESVD